MRAMLQIAQRNAVLKTMAELISAGRDNIKDANRKDLKECPREDLALYDRLKIDTAKIEGMIASLEELVAMNDPLGVLRYHFTHPNGMRVENRTEPFGTVLIIYESRPDVTIEAAGIAFKSGNTILLKGGKEALHSNNLLVSLWHQALRIHHIDPDWVSYLQFSREETQSFLQQPDRKIDLIVPRGGEKLIAFVKTHAKCPVIVSGRGNNFAYVSSNADKAMAREIILNAKTSKISACNALDKVLIDHRLPGKEAFISELIDALRDHQVLVWADSNLSHFNGCRPIEDEAIWFEEFLDYAIVLGEVTDLEEAIRKINTFSGGHSATIISMDEEEAKQFMARTDVAAAYQNASTRFTDGGQFGLGGELAISTDKLHQRGPLGLQHLCTNKWFVYGSGQVRNH
jgi:glutamate-5-semialdehyde dehydrogenase